MRRTIPWFVLACVVALVCVPARAQSPQPPQLVRIAAISPWIDDTHPFKLTVQVTNGTELALDDVELRVSFFARVLSRSELRDTVDRAVARASVGTVSVSSAPVEPGDQARITIQRTSREIPFVRSNGVYPIEISLRHAGGETAVRTAIPSFVGELKAPLNLVWVLPVTAPIITPPDGVYASDAVDKLGLEEMTQQMRAIRDHPGAGITLAPQPALLDTLEDLGGGFAVRGATGAVVLPESSAEAVRARDLLGLIRGAADAGEVAASPYAPADLPALGAHGLGNDVLRHVTLGRAAVEQRLERTPAQGLLVGGDVDAPTVRSLAGAGVNAWVLPQTTLRSPPTEPFDPQLFGPSRPVAIRAGSTEARALLVDEAMSSRIDTSLEGVVLAQTLIAETASAFFELPLFAPERVLVIASKRLPDPVALRAALDGFAGAPWVKLRRASDIVTSLEPQGDPADLIDRRTPDQRPFAAARAARSQLGTLDAITIEPIPDAGFLDRLVLLAEARDWESAPAAGESLARGASARVRAIIRGISVARRVVTLTSRRGSAPLTVFNGNPFPVRVRVRLVSPKLNFPTGAVQTREIAPPQQQFDIKIEARTAGSFPVDVLLETPDGKRVLARQRLTVRSTAISAVALGVVGGSIGLLLFSWARRSTRRRKPAATLAR